MSPTIVVFPYQTPKPSLDTECTDLAKGPKAETFLNVDVPAAVRARYRVRTDRAAWGLMGFPAGGFCATNLLLRHPDQFAAAASLSGYAGAGITIGDGSEATTNNPIWRLRTMPPPSVALYLAYALDDEQAKHDSTVLEDLAHEPMSVTTSRVNQGGHSGPVWREMSGPALAWISSHLARRSRTAVGSAP